MTTFSKKLVATVAASTIALSTAALGAPSALAQDPSATTPSGVPAAPTASESANLIDANAEVKLDIQKYEGEPGEGSGAPQDTSKLKPVPGVQFKIERIEGVDLTTAQGWGELAGMTPADLKGKTATEVATIETGADGKATIDTGSNAEFKVGVYRVTELQKGGYTVAPPFLITLPYSGTDGKWVYERTVYPKNQNVQPNKQVDASKTSLGSNMTYTINAPVPAGNLTQFEIKDPLVSNLELQTGSVKVTADGVQLAAGTDYNLTTDSNTVNVVFTDDGRAKLQQARKANAGMQVHVAFDAKVVSLPENGQINNTATITLPNGGTITTDVDNNGVKQPTSTTFGNLEITKTAEAESDPKLNGANFELYRCEDPEKDGKWNVLGDALNVATAQDGKTLNTTLTTGDTANKVSKANAYGIPISTTAGGATGTQTFDYCVIETKAPEGFVRDPEPRHVTVDAENRAMTVNVDNKKDSILGQLPATGAWGIVLIFLLGLALLARGLYTSYRDNKEQATA